MRGNKSESAVYISEQKGKSYKVSAVAKFPQI